MNSGLGGWVKTIRNSPLPERCDYGPLPPDPPTYKTNGMNPKTKPTPSSKQGTQQPTRPTTIGPPHQWSRTPRPRPWGPHCLAPSGAFRGRMLSMLDPLGSGFLCCAFYGVNCTQGNPAQVPGWSSLNSPQFCNSANGRTRK